MQQEPIKTRIKETMVLKKFDGDVTTEQIDAGEVEPVETITVEDGVIIGHWKKKDDNG